ncbi:hypothetical protein SeLEV6574_g06030 [Synchytrium endobioticum]|uniref:Uncharacterized protein n=1 Tax=Synchytrium endobioticum TaxID=286115 RepID=A0A507CQX8_9FUNG|nr:hypothetical protein SeLEV6574_g06030 [Synchytrium endobioticum]
MGIKYFWKYLTSLNVVKEKLGSVDSKQFFGVTGNAAPKGVTGRAAKAGYTSTSRKLKRIFSDGGTVFVIDGAPTSAKSETSMKRHREWGKVVDELDKVVAFMKQAADDGKKRMPKSFYEKLDRLTRRAFLVNDDVKTGLAAALEAEFKVEKAPGEADVYIGRVATDLDIVVSGIQTFFATGMSRQWSGRHAIEGSKAIVTNVKVFQKIKEKGDFSKEEMLKEYLKLCQSDRNFDVANDVFFNCDEGKVLDPLDRSKGREKRESLALISKARAALVANRGSRGNNYLLKAH